MPNGLHLRNKNFKLNRSGKMVEVPLSEITAICLSCRSKAIATDLNYAKFNFVQITPCIVNTDMYTTSHLMGFATIIPMREYEHWLNEEQIRCRQIARGVYGGVKTAMVRLVIFQASRAIDI